MTKEEIAQIVLDLEREAANAASAQVEHSVWAADHELYSRAAAAIKEVWGDNYKLARMIQQANELIGPVVLVNNV